MEEYKDQLPSDEVLSSAHSVLVCQLIYKLCSFFDVYLEPVAAWYSG